MGLGWVLMRRQCEFCKRFWRAVFSFALPAVLIAGAVILVACAAAVLGGVIAFFWAGTL
ncbi:hypothetical protein LCGC14_1805200 [marine sediment metagenome]|uniref:Uncharacterized protein n=1 Tax=marine sediment metagenome TaxID=412755 RepID=A0A0F9GNJ2_9ZZZZ